MKACNPTPIPPIYGFYLFNSYFTPFSYSLILDSLKAPEKKPDPEKTLIYKFFFFLELVI
jgi:hypothetical protein